MKHSFHQFLLGSVALAIMGFGQPGWSQQDSGHENHSDHESHAVPDTAQGSGDSQPMQQQGGAGHGDGHGAMMQQRQGNAQSGMMQQGQVDEQGRMIRQGQGQGDGQGAMMQQRQGSGQGGMMMQQGQGDGQGGMMMQGQGNGNGQEGMMQRRQRMRAMMGGGQHESAQAGGQDAFAAIRAVVNQLEANPETDWSQINITALRDHLIDMHEVTVNASVDTTEVAGGASYRVTGSGRTLEAIRRMVPTHAAQLTSETEWTAEAREIADGVEVTVTAGSDDQVTRIRALGFMGFMVSGEHHEMHHLAIVGGDVDAMPATENGGGGHSH